MNTDNELRVLVIINGFCIVCLYSVTVIVHNTVLYLFRYCYEKHYVSCVRSIDGKVKLNFCKYNEIKLSTRSIHSRNKFWRKEIHSIDA